MIQMTDGVAVVELVTCSCCEVLTVAAEISEIDGQCAACVFADQVSEMDAWVVATGADEVAA